MDRKKYNNTIFLNCPFDDEYRTLRDALVFAIYDCGFVPICALGESNSGDIRLDKIVRLIETARYGIHDISRVELSEANSLPRFNMPLELGLFLGAKRFGDKEQHKKNALILESHPYRYQQFISDIAGQDIRCHKADCKVIISHVRDWLATASKRILPGGKDISQRYERFATELPAMCAAARTSLDELTFNDFGLFVSEWLTADKLT